MSDNRRTDQQTFYICETVIFLAVIFAITSLIVLCAGEPDLLTAIIERVREGGSP